MKSLDPRITRLNIADNETHYRPQKSPEQLITFEVFLQKKENIPFEHVGIVHASDKSLALILAKEQFSRRSTCKGMMVVNSKDVLVSPYTDLGEDVYDEEDFELSESFKSTEAREQSFSIFHLTQRGKQHKLAGSVIAKSFREALDKAKVQFKEDKPVLNVWLVKDQDTLSFSEDDKDIWDTLPDKFHRDVTSYRAKDRMESFKANNQTFR